MMFTLDYTRTGSFGLTASGSAVSSTLRKTTKQIGADRDDYVPDPDAIVVTLDNGEFTALSSLSLAEIVHLLVAQESSTDESQMLLNAHRDELQHLSSLFVDASTQQKEDAFKVRRTARACPVRADY
jgi:hypothetical protein